MEQRPDWTWHNISDPDDLRDLTDLDLLRAHSPILWALATYTNGDPTTYHIASRLCMPYDVIKYELEEYQADGRLRAYTSHRGIVWELREPALLRLKRFARNMRSTARRASLAAGDPD